ncbi:MAG: hypothetical protein OEM25_01410 [Gammaproteobacteria bacterium]|nr:hypothetical protein [Gammaproteobacteria bacterium]
MACSNNLDPRILRLFDGYVHGHISRLQFIDRAAAITMSGVTAASILAR